MGRAVWDAGQLSDADLGKRVAIRGESLAVHEALHRSLAPTSSHVGQIMLLGKTMRGAEWRSLSIPRSRGVARSSGDAGVRIRPALADDRPFVIAAAERLAAFGPPAWRSAEEIVAGEVRTLEGYFAAPLTGTTLMIAESAQGDSLGFIYLEPFQDYFTLERHGHVGILVVIESAAGKGVGSALMRAADVWAREQGYRKLTLNVLDGNRTARAVYGHLGYAAESLRYVKIL